MARRIDFLHRLGCDGRRDLRNAAILHGDVAAALAGREGRIADYEIEHQKNLSELVLALRDDPRGSSFKPFAKVAEALAGACDHSLEMQYRRRESFYLVASPNLICRRNIIFNELCQLIEQCSRSRFP